MKQVSLIAAAGLATALSLAAQAQPTKQQGRGAAASVELSVLMRQALPEQGSTGLPPWTVLDGLPIHWKPPTQVPGAPGRRLRLGEVVVTVDGKPLYRHPSGAPGRWSVSLHGAASGVTSHGLSNEQNTLDATDSGLERLPAAGFTLKSLCRPRSATAPIGLWQVGAPGRATTLLAEERSSSQGGYSVSMSLYFDKSQARQLTCQ